MKDFAIQTLVILLGALFPLWLRAVRNAKSFSWAKFLAENEGRLWLLICGVLLTSALLVLDPTGIAALLESAGLPLKLGSNAVVGAAISAFILIAKKSQT